MGHTVKAVAQLAGISVRTLHHYDHVGVLKPASLSGAGYRLYSDDDLARLQQVLFFRELGFSLNEIKAIVDRPGFDRKGALLAHRELLEKQRQRLQELIQSIDRSVDAIERGVPMDEKEMFEGFDTAQIDQYREEARAKYGAEVVDNSYRRLGRFSPAERTAIFQESSEISQAVAALMDRDPSDAAVQQQVDRWFKLINRAFYDCTSEIFRGLGDLYVEDSRFTATYDAVRPGLAQFMRAAMHVYCDRLDSGS